MKNIYVSPLVEVIDVAIESGFAASDVYNPGGNLGGSDEE